MDNDYSSGLENPLYSELKYFCRKIQEAYNELKENLTPFRDDRFYRWVSCFRCVTLHSYFGILFCALLCPFSNWQTDVMGLLWNGDIQTRGNEFNHTSALFFCVPPFNSKCPTWKKRSKSCDVYLKILSHESNQCYLLIRKKKKKSDAKHMTTHTLDIDNTSTYLKKRWRMKVIPFCCPLV